jgi:hypothetical protein
MERLRTALLFATALAIPAGALGLLGGVVELIPVAGWITAAITIGVDC